MVWGALNDRRDMLRLLAVGRVKDYEVPSERMEEYLAETDERPDGSRRSEVLQFIAQTGGGG